MNLAPKLLSVFLVFFYLAFLGYLYSTDEEAKLVNKLDLLKTVGLLYQGEEETQDLLDKIKRDGFEINVKHYHHLNVDIGNQPYYLDTRNEKISIFINLSNGEKVLVEGRFNNLMKSENTFLIAVAVIGLFLVGLALFIFILIYYKIKRFNQALKDKNSELESMATKDELTGCYNRHHFKMTVPDYISQAVIFSRKVYVGFMDIDHFKNINDDFGHDVGDIVLSRFADFVRKRLPDNTPGFYRFGGEEFLFIIPDMQREEVDMWLNLIYQDISEFYIKEIDNTVAFSSGVTEVMSDLDDVASILKRADEALYVAKTSGRNQYTWKMDNTEIKMDLEKRSHS